MAERVDVFKGGSKQEHVIGTVVADKGHPPFVDGERKKPLPDFGLRWWGDAHPVSQRLVSQLVEPRTENNQRKLARVVIKEELVALTGDHIQALVLNQFLYWSERTKDFDRFLEEERKRNPEANVALTHGWIYKSVEELSGEIMLSVSPATVRRYLNQLVEAGYLDSRHNPNYKWDRCLQYRPNILKIQRDLQAMGYPLDGYPLRLDENPFCTVQNASVTAQNGADKVKNASVTVQNGNSTVQDGPGTVQNRSGTAQDRNDPGAKAIPETTTETTPEKLLEDGAGDQRVLLLLEFAQDLREPLDLRQAHAMVQPYTADQVSDLITYARQARGLRKPMAFVFKRLKTGELPILPAPVPEYAPYDDGPEPEDPEPEDPALVAGRELWGTVLDELALQMTEETFNAWFRPTRVFSFEQDQLCIEVENSYVKDWLVHRLLATIQRTLRNVAGETVRIEFVITGEQTAAGE